jgi:hypothetical protein
MQCHLTLALSGRLLDGSSRRVLQLPLEAMLKVTETSWAYPVVFILRAVSFVQDAREVSHHELRAAELAVIMIPIGIWGVLLVLATNERCACQVSLLPTQSPVVKVNHTQAAV